MAQPLVLIKAIHMNMVPIALRLTGPIMTLTAVMVMTGISLSAAAGEAPVLADQVTSPKSTVGNTDQFGGTSTPSPSADSSASTAAPAATTSGQSSWFPTEAADVWGDTQTSTAAPDQTGTPAPASATPATSATSSYAAPPDTGKQSSSNTGNPMGNMHADNQKLRGYDIQLRQLEENVNGLKEKIFQSKARLVLLKEAVLQGSISGAKAIIVHANEMGSSFRLEQVIYSLDGRPIYRKIDHDNDLAEQKEIELFNGAITPGTHNLSVYMVYRGHGFGIFSYLKGYVFRLRSSHAFTVEEGQIAQIKVSGYEKGNITTDIRERPDIKFDNRTESVNFASDETVGNKTASGVGL